MHSLPLRALLCASLILMLGACSDEPESATSSSDPTASTAASTTEAAPVASKPTPPPPKTPYEIALKALTSGSSMHFDSEVSVASGSVQYASGVGRGGHYAFSVRTLPQPDSNLDGNWYMQNGKYLKESTTGYDSSVATPGALALMVETLSALPRKESALSTEAAPPDNVAGHICQPRKVSMGESPRLLGRYLDLGVCVDEANGRLLKLSVQTQIGERLTATFTGHGEPVQLPDVKVSDWSQEFPLRQ
jgi:hypothetical protein